MRQCLPLYSCKVYTILISITLSVHPMVYTALWYNYHQPTVDSLQSIVANYMP